MSGSPSLEFPRSLTSRERAVTRWLICNGQVADGEKQAFLAQLDRAVVVRKCACGCASIDFAIDGQESSEVGMSAFGDFTTPNNEYGVFVFSKGDLLAGVEIYQMAALEPLSEFPEPVGFTPYPQGQNA